MELDLSTAPILRAIRAGLQNEDERALARHRDQAYGCDLGEPRSAVECFDAELRQLIREKQAEAVRKAADTLKISSNPAICFEAREWIQHFATALREGRDDG